MEEPILKIENLKKAYDGQMVLNGIDLQVRQGEVIVIVGPSGCGKSTLLRCINALEEIQGGSITLRGSEISKGSRTAAALRQKIGMVFQSYDLFPHMDVMENLLLGPTKALHAPKAQVIPEAEALLARVGLQDRQHALPRQLSGGQKQRVALVRAMLMHPEILLLDEITAALDPEMVHEVLRVVIDLAESGMTMAIVTHEMRFAEAVADRVVFLEDGLVVETATPEVFFHHPETERAQAFLKSFVYDSKKREKGLDKP